MRKTLAAAAYVDFADGDADARKSQQSLLMPSIQARLSKRQDLSDVKQARPMPEMQTRSRTQQCVMLYIPPAHRPSPTAHPHLSPFSYSFQSTPPTPSSSPPDPSQRKSHAP